MRPIITAVEDNSAAAKAGIHAGDLVLEINGQKVKTNDDISLYVAVANPEVENTFKVERNNGTYATIKVKPGKIGEGKEATYRYGISMQQENYRFSCRNCLYLS